MQKGKRKVKKKLTSFRPRIRSRHPSHSALRRRENMPLFPFKSVIRLGSSTDMNDTVSNGGDRIELNTIDAVKNSANKLLMKECFTDNEVKTAQWFKYDKNEENFVEQGTGNVFNLDDIPYPVVSKNIYGSRGTGNAKHDTAESLREWLVNKNTDKYIFEKFYNFAREYRLHVSVDGCFYTCRKMLKRDTPEQAKWYRNDDHCVWFMEENEQFDKPVNWDEVVEHSVRALIAVGLDFGAVDLRIQSATDKRGNKRENPDFIVVEINSAPSFGEANEDTFVKRKYLEELPRILMKKYNNRNER